MTTLDRMLKQLEDAASTVGREIERSGVGPAVRRGTDASMKVLDRTFDNVDAAIAKATVSARDLANRATADEKGTLNKVGKGLMEVREELNTKRMEWTGGWGETEARKVLETTRAGVDRAIQTVRKELNK